MGLFVCLAAPGWLPDSAGRPFRPDETDALGRQMPLQETVGPVKDGRHFTGIFYITWHGAGNHNLPGPYTDVTKILAEDPSARLDAHHPLWKYGSYHWGEPEAGYFLSQDTWLMRRDLSMLQDAGIDVLILDVTKSWTSPTASATGTSGNCFSRRWKRCGRKATARRSSPSGPTTTTR